MMNKLLSIIYAFLLLTVTEAQAETIQGAVLVNGVPQAAEYTRLTDNTVALGSGRNACISQYTYGRVIVPPQLTIDKKTYKVTEVMPLAFRFCTKLEMVKFPEGITRIGDFAFKGCQNIDEIILPSTLQSVASGAFIGLDKMTKMTCMAVTPPRWEYNDVFCFHEGGISDTQVFQFRQSVFLCVPAESAEAYKTSVFSNPALGWTTPEGWGTLFVNINGSALENYHVVDEQDLEDVRRISNDVVKYGNIKHLWFEADIEMSDTIWPKPIGADPVYPFVAQVHGLNHTISNLHVKSEDVAALIGHYAGIGISGLRLTGIYSEGKQMAAGLVASASSVTIDSCYVDCYVRSNSYAGIIAGQLWGINKIDRCVAEGRIEALAANANPYAGAIAGYASYGTVTNCAVISNFNVGDRSGHFVGGAQQAGSVTVDYSYSLNDELSNTVDNSIVKHGDHIILYGQPTTALTYTGEKININYSGGYMQSTYPASVLGTEGWVYTWNKNPLPDCFVNNWPVTNNYVVYGSEGAMLSRDNVLTPAENIPAEAWRDLTEVGFRHYRFKASRLHIDEHLNVQSRAEQLPLGISEHIASTNGVVQDSVLRADYKGVQDMMLPVYEIDDENNFVLDDEDNPILLGEQKVGEQDVWHPVGYAISLPYDVTFGSNATLYQPTRIYDVNGQATVLFEPVKDNRAEPFRPYYLVVRRDSVILGTQAAVNCTSLQGAVLQVGDFEFSGSMSNVDYSARKRNTYTLQDGSWQRQSATDNDYARIAPFTSFFRAIGSASPNNIVMTFSDDNPVISVGDFYYTLVAHDDGTYTATLTGYHGRGGNVIVPATITTAIGILSQQVPVTGLDADIFANNTAQLWSIDLSQCKDMPAVTVDRTTPGNPFYKVDERTIIYLPEGKAQPGKNVVVGTECASLTITDKWDFCPPYGFHTDEAEYSRILYATRLKNGTYQSYAYTVCLPFGMSEADWDAADPDYHTVIYAMTYVNTTEPRAFVFANHSGNLGGSYYPQAGLPYIVVVREGQFQFKAQDTWVTDRPEEYESRVSLYGDLAGTVMGDFKGTFSRISNEDAAAANAYSLSKGSWYRILSDEGSHRGAYVDAFRAYFAPSAPLAFNSYGTRYVWEPQGEEDIDYSDFPADDYVTDTDFSGYDDVIDGIQNIQLSPLSILNSNSWHTIDGRHVNGVPTEKGVYINKGRKIVIK